MIKEDKAIFAVTLRRSNPLLGLCVYDANDTKVTCTVHIRRTSPAQTFSNKIEYIIFLFIRGICLQVSANDGVRKYSTAAVFRTRNVQEPNLFRVLEVPRIIITAVRNCAFGKISREEYPWERGKLTWNSRRRRKKESDWVVCRHSFAKTRRDERAVGRRQGDVVTAQRSSRALDYLRATITLIWPLLHPCRSTNSRALLLGAEPHSGNASCYAKRGIMVRARIIIDTIDNPGVETL